MENQSAELETIRHYDDIQRFAEEAAEECIAGYEDHEQEIMALLYLIFEILGDGKIAENFQSDRKLQDLLRKLQEVCEEAGKDMTLYLDQMSQDLVENENHFLILAAAFLLLSNRKVTAETLENIARYGRYRGWTRKELVRKITAGAADRIFQTISTGLADGKKLSSLRLDVLREIRKTEKNIRTEVNTIVNGIVNDVNMAFAAKNNLKLRYSAVLDNKTCEECNDLNGNIYNSNDPAIPSLPRHYNCRCVLEVMFSSTSENQASYQDFFDSMTEKEKRSRLGSARYAEYRNGTLQTGTFQPVGKSAKLSLAQVRQRDENAFRS